MSKGPGRLAPNTFALSKDEREEAERREARAAFIKEQTKKAERVENLQERAAPDIIYNALQEQGLYTADPKKDNDAKRVREAQSLLQLVKEFEVGPTGDWHVTLPQPAIEAVAKGIFCVECYERQPEDQAEWESRMAKLEGVIGPRPGWAEKGTCCCFCGNRLGIHREYEPPPLYRENMTDDQLRILAEMFGPDPFSNITRTKGA
jgi:hypothetical protein